MKRWQFLKIYECKVVWILHAGSWNQSSAMGLLGTTRIISHAPNLLPVVRTTSGAGSIRFNLDWPYPMHVSKNISKVTQGRVNMQDPASLNPTRIKKLSDRIQYKHNNVTIFCRYYMM